MSDRFAAFLAAREVVTRCDHRALRGHRNLSGWRTACPDCPALLTPAELEAL